MDIKEEIKQKIDIVELISRYISLKKAGSIYKANCPFHNENTPSFSVSQSLQIYKCFGCGKGGDVFSFIMEIEGIDFKEALYRLGEIAGVDTSNTLASFKPNKNANLYLSVNNKANQFYKYILTQNEAGKDALDYLKNNRGLTFNQIKELELGYAPNNWDTSFKFLQKKGFSADTLVNVGLIKKSTNKYYDAFRGRITIPLINEKNELVGFSGRDIVGNDPKYLNTKETDLFKKSKFLFNLNNAKVEIKKQKYVLVVEGIFDAITPYIKGIKNVVASQGTALTTDQIKLIKRYTDTAVLLFDNDAAGSEATIRGIELAQNNGIMVKIATLPHGYKDPDEAAKKSVDIIYKSVDEALNAFDYFFKYAKNKFDVSDSYGKSSVAKFLKPKILRISDTVLKGHYIKKLAELLQVSEQDLDILNNPQVINNSAPANTNNNLNLEPNVNIFIVYLLNSPEKIFNKYYKLFKTNKLLLKKDDLLLTEYKKLVIKQKMPKNEYLQITKYKEVVEYCFLQNIGDFSVNEDLANKTLSDILKKQQVYKLKKQLSKIRAKILNAESNNYAKKLDILQKKANILAKQLSNLN